MVKVEIKQKHSKCVGCGTCVSLCPVKIWERGKDGKAHPTKPFERCILCKRCERNCPVQIISIKSLGKCKPIPKGKTPIDEISHPKV